MLSVYEPNRPTDAVTVAVFLAGGLHARGQEYALGGALALGYWGIPRGTVDVDVTLFLAPERPSDCIWLLQEIGCEVPVASAEFDRLWVREQLLAMYGSRDPRLATWDELDREVSPS